MPETSRPSDDPRTAESLAVRRRSVLAVGAGAAAGLPLSVAALPGPAAADTQRVFQHGVASGDPLPRSVVLWTRVTPTPASTPGSGKGPTVPVLWEVAADRRFRRVLRRGRTSTGPERDHTVKVDAGGLRPGTEHWYRFRALGAFVRELVRIVKPGGVVIVTTPNQLSALSLLTLLVRRSAVQS